MDLQVKATGSQYLVLQHSRLYVKAKIIKEDLGNVIDEDKVSPINLWLQSMFSQMDVYFQQKLVIISSMNHPYKSYLDVLLNYGIYA